MTVISAPGAPLPNRPPPPPPPASVACTSVHPADVQAVPVDEGVKQTALAACDVLLSLVDNVQETFGLSVAEALAAGRPVVASNWDGYRDLIRDGVDGFLVPTRWADIAPSSSFPLGWMQKLDLMGFPLTSGTLAQLVQIDLDAAEQALLTLLTQPVLARAMGRMAGIRARQNFAVPVVMAAYQELFADLAERRGAALSGGAATCPRPAPLQFDPVRCFAQFASGFSPEPPLAQPGCAVPQAVIHGRQTFNQQLRSLVGPEQWEEIHRSLGQKHGGVWGP